MKLDLDIKPETIHVAMVMDGNGRWANERALARLKGHAKVLNMFAILFVLA